MAGMRRNDSPPVRGCFSIREFKTLDDARGTFCGYLSVFNVEDQIWADPTDKGDIVEPGAFAKTLADMSARQQTRLMRNLPSGRYMLPIFWAHDAKDPIGGFTTLREDTVGLYFEAELDMNIQQGQRAYSGLKAGYIPGMSFGYFAVRFNYDRVGRRHLLELSVFEGTVTPIPMNQEAVVLEIKAATDEDKKAQAARAKKYGISVKDGGNVTKPSQYSKLSDDDFADPVNYAYPVDTKAHADNAASRFGDADNRSKYSSAEQGKINDRIEAAQKKFGEDDKESKSVEVAADGSHASFKGTHSHAHSAFGSQGDDSTHSHEHTHDGDATHDHAHDEASSDGDSAGDDDAADDAGTMSAKRGSKKSARTLKAQEQIARAGKKAADFATSLTSIQEQDTLQSDWHDIFCALVSSAYSLICRAVYDVPLNGADDDTDPVEQAKTNASAFSDAFVDLITRSIAAEFVPCMDYDGDSFTDPDDEDDGPDYYSLDTAEAEGKAGRTISDANAKAMYAALDTMQAGHAAAAKGMQQARAGHKTATALLKSMSSSSSSSTEDNGDFGINYDGSQQDGSVRNVETPDGKSAAVTAPGAHTKSDTTHPLSAEDMTRMIRDRMAARQAIQTAIAASHKA